METVRDAGKILLLTWEQMIQYFGYGSNMDLVSLRAKGVEPHASAPAVLRGWELVFNVRHWFRHEGGVGNIRPSANPGSEVHGVVHQCVDGDLVQLDAMESRGVGYDRILVEVETGTGAVPAHAYIGLPAFLDDSCRPTQRYLNILVKGAEAANLPSRYVARLREHPVQPMREYPPFRFPPGSDRIISRETLAGYPQYTAVGGAVFDMTNARPDLAAVKPLLGGRDTTLFHLKRLDTSDGSETLDDVRLDRISDTGRRYLNAYLHEYDAEFEYVGRFTYDSTLPRKPDRSNHG